MNDQPGSGFRRDPGCFYTRTIQVDTVFPFAETMLRETGRLIIIGVTHLNERNPKIRGACGRTPPYFWHLFSNCVVLNQLIYRPKEAI